MKYEQTMSFEGSYLGESVFMFPRINKNIFNLSFVHVYFRVKQ